MKWYLAGPMSGIPQFNIPLFDKVTAELRGRGYEIVSPAELDSEATREEALASTDGAHSGTVGGETWGEILARDVRVIADEVDGLIFLPGWAKSKGARLEATVGTLTDKRFAFYNTEFKCVLELSRASILIDIYQESRRSCR